jgi:hypothetical protein
MNEQDIPKICSYGAEIARNNADKRRIVRILNHHLFDVDAALESELKAWSVWETVNGSGI